MMMNVLMLIIYHDVAAVTVADVDDVGEEVDGKVLC